MGRGKSWEGDENEALARAWICASEDPVTGANQTSKTFCEALYRRFIEKGPPAATVPDGRYGFRTVASCKAHFDVISADAQKFFVSLRKLRACSPTGVSEDSITSMAVAVHTGATKVMDYEQKDLTRTSGRFIRLGSCSVEDRNGRIGLQRPAARRVQPPQWERKEVQR